MARSKFRNQPSAKETIMYALSAHEISASVASAIGPCNVARSHYSRARHFADKMGLAGLRARFIHAAPATKAVENNLLWQITKAHCHYNTSGADFDSLSDNGVINNGLIATEAQAGGSRTKPPKLLLRRHYREAFLITLPAYGVLAMVKLTNKIMAYVDNRISEILKAGWHADARIKHGVGATWHRRSS